MASITSFLLPTVEPDNFQRHLSNESVNSMSSCGGDSQLSSPSKMKKKSKLKLTGQNSWIRSSFSRAFKKNKPPKGCSDGLVSSDAEMSAGTGTEADEQQRSVPSSPMPSTRSFRSSSSDSKSATAR